MIIRRFILFYITCYLHFEIDATHSKKVAKTLWSEKCTKNSYALNDCNWCKCNERYEFNCKARVCNFADMFGHFNDAIRDLDVGMEGHGAWRTSQTACDPGVPYTRDELLCICTEEGTWPNPICKNNFQFLHNVELTKETKPSAKLKCAPTKLHLIGCNVCYCPSTGYIDPEMCTKHNCPNNDPVYNKNVSTPKHLVEEVYSKCKQNVIYKLGCKTCLCLKNNKLLCDNCAENSANPLGENGLCSDKEANVIFKKDCNLCYCRKDGLMHCSVKRCQNDNNKRLKRLLTVPNIKFSLVERPYYNQDCEIGTQYKKDCNTCYCFEQDGSKTYGCTMKRCTDTVTDLNSNCVDNYLYELNCQICHCYMENGVKIQVCRFNEKCMSKTEDKPRTVDLKYLHGYCEPFHVYKDDCNDCKCQEDGKSLVCTADICNGRRKKPVNVEIIPIKKELGKCPKGSSYKIDCNVCFCLANGNTICTTIQCDNSLK